MQHHNFLKKKLLVIFIRLRHLIYDLMFGISFRGFRLIFILSVLKVGLEKVVSLNIALLKFRASVSLYSIDNNKYFNKWAFQSGVQL